LGRKEWHFVSYSVWFSKRKRYARFCSDVTTDISTSFEVKEQTVTAFLDISGAYGNVLMCDVMCGVMLEKELPLGIVRFMCSLLWCKTLVLSCVGGAEWGIRVQF
jgi:hypothetical protein